LIGYNIISSELKNLISCLIRRHVVFYELFRSKMLDTFGHSIIVNIDSWVRKKTHFIKEDVFLVTWMIP